MNENKVIVWLYTLVTAVIAVLATAFNMILEKYYIESGTGLYKIGTVTPDAFNVFMILGVIVLSVSVFMFRKDDMPKGVYNLPVITALFSVLAAVVLVYSAVGFLMDPNNSLPTATDSVVRKIKCIGAYVSFPAGLYYFISVFSGKTRTKTETAFSFFPLIWTWATLLGVYFDHTVEMSSPVRVIKEIALIMLLLAQVMETRALIGRSKPLIYLIVSAVAVIFLSPAYMPAVIKVIGGEMKLSYSAAYDIYGAVMAVYLFARIFGYAIKCSAGPKKEKKHKHGKNDIFSEEDDIENVVDSEPVEMIEEHILEESEPTEENGEQESLDESEEPVEFEEPEEAEENEENEEDKAPEDPEENVAIDDIFKEKE